MTEISKTEPIDDGLALERTDLAWNRSGLAVATCIALLLRRIWPLRGTHQVVALACISAGAISWALVISLGRKLVKRAEGARLPLTPLRATVITVGTVALAGAAAALAFYPPR